MKYQISVPKIHCSGCVGLIKMSLDEIFGESNVKVFQDLKIAEIVSEDEIDNIKSELDKIFKELAESGYFYTDLKLITE
jgi:copper chaperone CopZ